METNIENTETFLHSLPEGWHSGFIKQWLLRICFFKHSWVSWNKEKQRFFCSTFVVIGEAKP